MRTSRYSFVTSLLLGAWWLVAFAPAGKAAAAATPTFSPSGGNYLTSQTVTIATTTSGASIRYTTDGTTPSDTVGTLYTGALAVSVTTTLKAVAYATGYTNSAVATAVFNILVATPTFSPAGGNYLTAQAVAITTTTSGASIRYTTDGSTPSDTVGTLYTGALPVSATTTLKAVAYAPGYTNSAVATAVFNILVATPTFSPGGGNYLTAQTVTIATSTIGASIRYTTDGSTPSNVAGALYSGPVTVSSTTTLKAIAYAPGYTNSAVATAVYNILAATPTFSPSGGNYLTAQTVTIGTTTGGASIRYTTDGTTPSDTVGTVYNSPITVSATTTLKAVAYSPGYTNSAVATAVYNVLAATPTFTPMGGNYLTPQTVTIATTTGGAGIRYTTDGTTPSDTVGTVYTGPLTVSATTTLKAVAYASGYTNSAVATAVYNILAATPTFSPTGGNYLTAQTVTIATTTSGASIRYTTDGTTPSATAGTVYSGPLTVSTTSTLKAVAYATGYTNSAVATAVYNILAATPTFSPSGGNYVAAQTVTIATTTSGANIRYTMDGSTPSDTVGTVYTGPLTVSATTTLKAVAYATGYTNSAVATAVYNILAATPTFSPTGGNYLTAQTVTIATTTSGANVRYTTDGTTPSDTVGTIYNSPITVSATTTLKAVAYASGYTNSAVATAVFNILAATPTFSPAGGNYLTAQTVSISTATSGASIRYTTDGTTPSDTVGTVYTAPLTISATTTLKAVAYATGYTNSAVATAVYNILAATPTFSPSGGNYLTAQTVTIATATSGASIRYTTDGTTPSDTAGTVYSGPLTISATTTLKAVAYATGYTNSAVATAVYNILAATPTFTPSGGNYLTPQTVTMATATTGASIRYTTDGTTPSDTVGTLYTGPLTISATTTLKAVAYATGYTNSAVATAVYNILAATPTFSPAGGNYSTAQTVTIATATSGANIRYTTDGTTPSDTVGTVYAGPLTVSTTTTLKAVAYAPGYTNSAVATAVYNISNTATQPPTFSPAGGTYSSAQTITLSTATTGASIRYTTDGTTPSETAGTVYLSPFVVSSTTTVMAIAYISGLSDSTVSTATYTIANGPTISSLSPTSGPAGTSVTITGSNFGSHGPYDPPSPWPTVTFNGINADPSSVFWSSSTSIGATVPSGATTGNVVVTLGGAASNGVSFAVTSPAITGVSPNSGSAGVQVTISGAAFGAAQGTGSVWLGSTYASVVSWSNTQVVATVPSIARSGTVQVQQGGIWSNGLPFQVNIATITSVTPSNAFPGTQVTIAGSGFGGLQGSGQVWLGGAYGIVQSWSDAQIVAVVAPGSAFGNAQAQAQARQSRLRAAARRRQSRLGGLSGVIPPRSHAEAAPPAAGGSGSGAQVLQNGVWSDPASFSVETLQVTDVSPASAGPGSSITITGTGFGNFQGSGAVWLGSTYGQVMSWSDTQVVAAVAASSLTGIVRIQQNNVWSNALTFTLPGNTTILLPNLLNMAVGDTATVQATGLSGQPLTGLTWTSSDPAVVSLSTDDPPVLTAVAPGHVTIVAGTASIDVTVTDVSLTGTLPIGTVLWSNPGDGSGVYPIVPAVPSPSGVADVFAFNFDRTVSAIRSDGTTAWTADVSQVSVYDPILPDFLGGLVAPVGNSIVRYDGMTGQTQTVYTAASGTQLGGIVPHPDGTVFTIVDGSLMGIDSTTGAVKVSVPETPSVDPGRIFAETPPGGDLVIAGDGYAYHPYAIADAPEAGGCHTYHLMLLRANSSGASDNFKIVDQHTCGVIDFESIGVNMITNADQGIVLTWGGGGSPNTGMAITTGTSVSLVNAPALPNGGLVVPVLQAQDGSFIGTVGDWPFANSLTAFDQSGNLRWSVPGNWNPQIATADGGVIATDDLGNAITFDQNGNATGQMANLPTYSWTGAYQVGSIESIVANLDLAAILALTYAATPRGNLTANGFSLVHHTFGIVFCGPEGGLPCPVDNRFNSNPVQFSYLPIANLNDQTYNAPPPNGPVDFSGTYPYWVLTMKKLARDTYKAAFARMPAVISQGWGVSPVAPQNPDAPHYEHTVYVSGKWFLGGDFGPRGEPTGNTTGFGNCTNNGIYPGICATSNVFYLSIMGYAQQALQFLIPGSSAPLSPTYPPSNPTAVAQFNQVMTAIGTGIGNIAAHETGHQLHLPQMDCSSGLNDACSENYIYQNGNSSGKSNEWFYGSVPGGQIHWSPDAQCKIYKFLGMVNTGCN